MKSLFKKKQPTLIGLDIGTRYIKAVVIESDDDSYKLSGFAYEPIGKDAFSERELKDFDSVSIALKKVKLTLKSKIKDCVVAVAGTSVISKLVYMEPDQSDFELESQIEIEADSLIPYPLDEVYLDFEELGPSETHIGKVNVLLSASHKDIVDSRLMVVREVELEPKAVDIENYALGNAINYFYPKKEEGQPVCCINIGASLMQVCVWRDDTVVYTKEHAFGIDMLIQDLSIIHMMDRQQAEEQLVNDALPANWQSDTLPVFAANLQQQLNRALQMYMSTLNAERPDTIVISGAAATMPALVETLQQDMGINIEVFNPFANMEISDKLNEEQLNKIAPLFTVAAGLASRSFTTWHM